LKQYPIPFDSASRSLLLSALFICAMCQICCGYLVLTHEEIVDLLWLDQVKHLLLQKFPGTTDDALRSTPEKYEVSRKTQAAPKHMPLNKSLG
jgi:hypothetical protein